MSRVNVVDLSYANAPMIDLILAIRRSQRIKLPDAIIAASAILHRASLITRDAQLLALNGTVADLQVAAF